MPVPKHSQQELAPETITQMQRLAKESVDKILKKCSGAIESYDASKLEQFLSNSGLFALPPSKDLKQKLSYCLLVLLFLK